jgi:hypothetical protein
VAETNDTLWNALLQLLTKPERIHSLIAPARENDTETLKQDLATVEREDKAIHEKQQRLLDLYLEGNIPEASYVLKSSELETQVERLSQRKVELQKQIGGTSQRDLTSELIQTLRILARSHRRFTEEQKTKIFRSIVKEVRLSESLVELELYGQPTQNLWFKYRHRSDSGKARTGNARIDTVRVAIPQEPRPDKRCYTTTEVAGILGITPGLLRWRIMVGKYPDAPRGFAARRMFTIEHIENLRSIVTRSRG